MKKHRYVFRLSAIALACISFYTYAEESNLDTIEVNATSSIGSQSLNNGYGAVGSPNVAGLPMTLRQTPQSISVISEQQIKDQGLDNVEDVIKQAVGVTKQSYGSQKTGYNLLYARGNQIQNYSVDGLAFTNGGKDSIQLTSSAIYDRIEVVRGISTLMQNVGEPSATINLIRKRPTEDFQGEVRLKGGSWQHYGGSVDLSSALNKSGTVRGRFVVDHSRGHSYINRVSDRNSAFYGITEWDLSKNTTLSIGANYQDILERGSSMRAISTYDNQGYRTNFDVGVNGAANWSYGRSKQLTLFTELRHRFSDSLEGKIEYNYMKESWDQLFGIAGNFQIDHTTLKPIETANPNLPPPPPPRRAPSVAGWFQNVGWVEEAPHQHSVAASFNGQFDLWGRKQDVMFGFNAYYYSDNSDIYKWIPTPVGNIYEYAATGDVRRPTQDDKKLDAKSVNNTHQAGGYLATRLRPTDKLSVILGARATRYHRILANRYFNGDITKSRITPYTGLVYDFNDNFSGYISYAASFKPHYQPNYDGGFLEPMTGTNLETGIKSEFFDGGLNVSASIYESRKTNEAERGGLNPQTNKVYFKNTNAKTKGWEIEMSGKINDNWLIQAGVNQTVSHNNQGERIYPDMPRTQFKLFTTYKLNNWTIGAGTRWQSKIYDYSSINSAMGGSLIPNRTAEMVERAKANSIQKAYWVTDLMLRYNFTKKADVTVNLNNIFNKHYRTTPHSHNYGIPFNIVGTFSYKF